MALNDDAVIVAAQGFVYINDVGSSAPTPSEVDALDPVAFGSQHSHVVVTGTPTSFSLTIGGDETAQIVSAGISTDSIRQAVEAVASVGVGNTKVVGAALTGFDIYFVADKLGETVTVAEGTYVGGTTPDTTVTTTAPNGWVNIGHTSRSDLPEWGFDGGKFKMKGSWQKKSLRLVQDAEPIEDSVMLSLEQWNDAAMELYFGQNISDTDGVFGVDGNFFPIEKAFLIILVDGDARVGFYAPKASIQRDKAVKLPLDDFAALPIKSAFLSLGALPLYSWISAEHFSSN